MIILVGASASGKTVVAKRLGEMYGIEKFVTHTTRNMRVGEQDGVDYFFVTKQKFLNMQVNDKFVETTIYNENYYGTAKANIGFEKVLIVEPMGLKSFIELNNPRIVTFYLDCPESVRYERMLSRGDDKKLAQERINLDKHRFSLDKVEIADYIINAQVNSIDEVTDLVYSLYKSHLAKLDD
ncbi:MAG: guanylate kinase [Erysipelotrichaceae bacterium]|nr:guanylate kinase [Erysipelotrichaceae bacterium]